MLEKYEKIWDEIKYLIKAKNNNLVIYDDKYLRIKVHVDDDLPSENL